MYEAIILAGGFGTRLREAVPDLPKPMAPVAKRPFLEWQMDYLIGQGVTRFILALGYKAEIIQSHFGDQYKSASIVYAVESTPLGTGGAIQYALSHATHDRVFVVNGDSLCEVNLAQLRQISPNKNDLGIVVKYVENAGRYGAVEFDEPSHKVTAFGEKSSSFPGYINAGIYDLPRNLFDKSTIAAPFSFETEVLHSAINENLFTTIAGNFFIDIGIPEDFKRAQTEIPAIFG